MNAPARLLLLLLLLSHSSLTALRARPQTKGWMDIEFRARLVTDQGQSNRSSFLMNLDSPR